MYIHVCYKESLNIYDDLFSLVRTGEEDTLYSWTAISEEYCAMKDDHSKFVGAVGMYIRTCLDSHIESLLAGKTFLKMRIEDRTTPIARIAGACIQVEGLPNYKEIFTPVMHALIPVEIDSEGKKSIFGMSRKMCETRIVKDMEVVVNVQTIDFEMHHCLNLLA